MYLVIAAVIGAVVFVVAMLLFGRGEQLPPLAARTSPAQLPARGVSGDDVRAVKFSLAARGYRMSDVDWTLERLAVELDQARQRIAELEGPVSDVPADEVDTYPYASDVPLFHGERATTGGGTAVLEAGAVAPVDLEKHQGTFQPTIGTEPTR